MAREAIASRNILTIDTLIIEDVVETLRFELSKYPAANL